MPFNHLLDFRSLARLERMTDADRKDLLREVLSRGPSEDTWRAILELFAMWPEDEAKLGALDAADAAMSGWDDRLRALDTSRMLQGTRLSSLARIVRSISIYRSAGRGETELLAVARSPDASRLTRLEIVRCEIGPNAWQSMIESSHLSNLRDLQVVNTLMPGDSFQRLVQGARMPSLCWLQLTGAGLGPQALQAVTRSAPSFALRIVDLSRNVLGDDGATALAEADWLSSVERLILRRTHVREAGMRALLSSPVLQRLKQVDLRDNGGRGVDVAALRSLAVARGIELLASSSPG